LDVFAVAPGGNVSYVLSVAVFIVDGNITIDFVGSIGDPQINGIEIFDDGAPIPPPTSAPVPVPAQTPNSAPVDPSFQDILINCGGKYSFDIVHQ